MRNHAKISQVAHYLPKKIVTNDDLAQRMETSDEWIRSRTGIGQRHIVTGETTSDLASQVARKLLEKSQLDASEIDFIIVATITPDASMPSTALWSKRQLVRKRLLPMISLRLVQDLFCAINSRKIACFRSL